MLRLRYGRTNVLQFSNPSSSANSAIWLSVYAMYTLKLKSYILPITFIITSIFLLSVMIPVYISVAEFSCVYLIALPATTY